VIAILWRYKVRPERVADFERVYDASGDWAKLFARASGYLGTELLRDGEGSYLTIDRWHARGDFDNFLTAHRADYEALDKICDGWTIKEERLGIFEALD
jgi:heme-degrading monooxygenase HmoA